MGEGGHDLVASQESETLSTDLENYRPTVSLAPNTRTQSHLQDTKSGSGNPVAAHSLCTQQFGICMYA